MHVAYAPDAARDLAQYLAVIEADDPAAAERVQTRIETTLDLLAERPGLGRRRRVRGLPRLARVFSLTPLPILAIYQETTEGILVLRLYHGARVPIVR